MTIFSGRLIHMWCFREQHDDVKYVGLSQNKLQCGFMVMKEHVTWCSSEAHRWVYFLSFFFFLEGEEISSCDSQLIVSGINSLLAFVFSGIC